MRQEIYSIFQNLRRRPILELKNNVIKAIFKQKQPCEFEGSDILKAFIS